MTGEFACPGFAQTIIITSDFINDFPYLLVTVCQKMVSQWRGEYTINLVQMELLLVRGLSVWSLIPVTSHLSGGTTRRSPSGSMQNRSYKFIAVSASDFAPLVSF